MMRTMPPALDEPGRRPAVTPPAPDERARQAVVTPLRRPPVRQSVVVRAPQWRTFDTFVRNSSTACASAVPPPLTSKWPVIRTAA